ncbi:MAG: hypothetical protein JSW36_04960 [Burkholderiales bacterium]|nr:MAG: hypothetical protein JSW36_04960 [Burkholderiales bacterium]
MLHIGLHPADASIDEFKTHFRGDVLRPGDPSYDETRQIWNATIVRKPALIARCTSAGDVVEAVKFARFTETMPDELNVWMVTRKAPPLPFLPADVHGKEIVAPALAAKTMTWCCTTV